MSRLLRLCFACWCLCAAAGAPAQTSELDTLAAKAVVRSFHDALARGDIEAVKQLLAADAVILENGHIESRSDYLLHHLGADIEFAKAVPSQLTAAEATVSGNTAWVRSSSTARGKFRNHVVNLANAELVVLTRGPAGWEIRAVHWSSHESK